MTSSGRKSRIPNGYLPLLLAFIFIDETSNNFIFSTFTAQSHTTEFFLYSSFLLLSIIASPIQAGYSDFFCRKKSLIVSLSASLLSLLLISFSTRYAIALLFILPLVTLAKAGFGNTLPLSWAAIADTQSKNFRFSLGLSTSAMAFGYLGLLIIKTLFKDESALITSCLFIVLIFFCITKFEDIRDKKPSNFDNPSLSSTSAQKKQPKLSIKTMFISEVKLIINNFLKDRRTRKALLAFMLWEISFYCALIVDIDMKISEFKNLSLSILLGYLVGVVFLRFMNKKKDEEMIKIGYYISIFSLIPIFILGYFLSVTVIMIYCYFFYSLAAAFLAPSLFAILSKERKPHEQGKIYGLIDSTDTIAFLLASISVMIYHSCQLNPMLLAFFSFIVFLISYIPYAQFKKIEPKMY